MQTPELPGQLSQQSPVWRHQLVPPSIAAQPCVLQPRALRAVQAHLGIPQQSPGQRDQLLLPGRQGCTALRQLHVQP